MENSFNNTGNNDENSWLCQKPNGVYYKTTRHVNSLDDSIIAWRVRDSISPGDSLHQIQLYKIRQSRRYLRSIIFILIYTNVC